MISGWLDRFLMIFSWWFIFSRPFECLDRLRWRFDEPLGFLETHARAYDEANIDHEDDDQSKCCSTGDTQRRLPHVTVVFRASRRYDHKFPSSVSALLKVMSES